MDKHKDSHNRKWQYIMKKHIVPFIAILCIVGMLLAACAAGSAPTEPVDAPASVSEFAPEPEPGPELQSRFDAYVEQYEQENGVGLSSTDDEKCSDFFAEICAQAYTKEDALTDKAATSEKNQALLAQYIEYLDAPRHEECAFDIVVGRVLQEIAEDEITLTEEQKTLTLYGTLYTEGITPEDIAQWGCTNEYKDWYIEEYNSRDGGFLTEEELIARETLTEEQLEEHRRQAEEAMAILDEESARRRAEDDKWMEENFDLYG